MTLNLKTLALGPFLSRTFTAPLGSQRGECVVGEFSGSFGGDGAESFPTDFFDHCNKLRMEDQKKKTSKGKR
jgi:hypothetical protein